MQAKFLKIVAKTIVVMAIGVYVSISLAGCSAGANGLISITPEQYLASAKEQFETMEERDYEVRDLDEIVRILENAEKNAKKSEVIDSSRIFLCLTNTLKAHKQYKDALVKGEYVANRPEPFYTIDTKEVKETLRTAKKWLRLCNSTFKTNKLLPDLNYVKGIYFSNKMLTQQSRDRQESLEEAILGYRRCLGLFPDYKGSFRLFGMDQTPREVRLRLIECLAQGGMAAEAYGILSEFNFAPISPIPGSTDKEDYPWHHTKAMVLAFMGKYEEAAAILDKYKIVTPEDYPMIDDAIWLLEGIYKKLYEITKNDKYDMEAKIAASILNKLEGPFSSETYSDASYMFPRQLPGDLQFFDAVVKFYEGNFDGALEILEKLDGKSAMSSSNRVSAKLYKVEALLYSGQRVTDDVLQDMLELSSNKYLNLLQKEKLGYLLARYIMDEDASFDTSRVNHEGQNYIRSITSKPWTLDIKRRRGELKTASKPIKKRSFKEDEKNEESEREPGELIVEMYANKSEDWIVSANMYLVSLPDMNILTPTRVVGREDDGKWYFKDEQIDLMKRSNKYLAIFEYDNSDSEKSIQGCIFQPGQIKENPLKKNN